MTMIHKPITEQTPAEIDTVLAANWTEQYKHRMKVWAARKEIEAARAMLDRGRKLSSWDAQKLEWSERDLASSQTELTRLLAEATPYEDEYRRRGGWNRYYLVANNNGHVHRGMDCTTCFPTTEYNWLPTLSDCDEAAMVAEWGEVACTICFPDAPTMKGFGDGTSAFARLTAEAREAKQAEKDARNAAKAAKLLVEPVRITSGRWTEKVTTVAAAKQGIRDAVSNTVYYGITDDRVAAVWLLAEALMAKGLTAEEIDTIATRAQTKARKEVGA